MADEITGNLKTRIELARVIQQKLESSEPPRFLSLAEIQSTVEALFEVVSETESVGVRGFGEFRWKLRKERTHFNAGTRKMEPIPPKHSLTFKPSRKLKRRVRLDG